MRPAAADRLRRLLALIPWLVAEGGASIDEVARRFGLSRDQAVKELELAACCGLPPYSPDQLVDFVVEEDWVSAYPSPVFLRPQQFSAAEGFALLAAGRALLAVAGGGGDPAGGEEGPLGRALAKLEAVLGDGGRLEVDVGRPPHLDTLMEAAEQGRRLQLEYYSAWRDELTSRAVDPWVVYSRDGRWYVDGYCHLVEDSRRFRVDRIRAAQPTGETFERLGVSPPVEVFEPADARRVTLDLPAEARWVVETYQTEWEQTRGGRLRVTMAVAGLPWLERLLLRVGPDARVVAPDDLEGVGADAARRLLGLYRR